MIFSNTQPFASLSPPQSGVGHCPRSKVERDREAWRWGGCEQGLGPG